MNIVLVALIPAILVAIMITYKNEKNKTFNINDQEYEKVDELNETKTPTIL